MANGITPLAKWARANARIRNEYVFETISEFLGTFVLCLFAVGASAQHLYMQETFLMPVFGGVFGLMIAVTVFGGASGAHINPAVSLALAIAGELSWFKIPLYWIAQMFGGYLGAGLAFALYKDKLCGSEIDGQPFCPASQTIFSPLPATASPVGLGIADQIVCTAILLLAIMSAIDPRNMKVPKYLFGIFFAFVVSGVSFAFGVNAGGVMNPARDLGPRLMAVTIGHDFDLIFKRGTEHYWLVPLIGPLVGATVGALIYIFFVGSHLRDDEVPEPAATGGDWRSTVFIPKAIPYQASQQQIPPQTPIAANNPYGNGAPYQNYNAGGGVNNNGYIRDDGKPMPRQIY